MFNRKLLAAVISMLASAARAEELKASPPAEVPALHPAATAQSAPAPASVAPAENKPISVPASEPPKVEVPRAPTFVFAFHGFVSGTLFAQDAYTGTQDGQGGSWLKEFAPTANGQTAYLKPPNTDRLVFGGDVRQSRFNFSLAGPPVLGGATPKAVLEFDFFGGYGSGNYGDINLVPRLRLAYAELDWGRHRVVVGQANDLIFTIAPNSLSHVNNTLATGAGGVGWRRPAVFGFHTFGPKDGQNLEIAWEVGRANWADSGKATGTADDNGIGQSYVGNGGDPYGFNLGEASGLPAVEARVAVADGTRFLAYAAGHVHKVDRSGFNATAEETGYSDLTVLAGSAGAKYVAGPLTVAASGWIGKNVAPLGGAFLQFQGNTVGNVNGYGAWAQAGFNFTKELSAWVFGGFEKTNEDQAITAKFTKLRNINTTLALQYREGGFGVALEWVHLQTRLHGYASATITAQNAALITGDFEGNQWLTTANYYF